ncbi:unnamed protein product [Owenia fusiformis]|uniref:Peptidase M14 domain-containing protein n=1 Tax=Owenia fusiformis TaxID=6347 RepID=A0A8S4NFK8_OWEFU|nr:unnamed protein product [Owenia fusiformis]
MWKIAFLFLSVAAVLAERKRYDGHKLLRITPTTQEDLDAATKFIDQRQSELDFWKLPRGVSDNADLRVSPEEYDTVAEQLRAAGVNFNVIQENLQDRIDEDYERLSNKAGKQPIDLEDFNRHGDINTWLTNQAASCTGGVQCTTYDIGNSYEGRTMRVIRIGINSSDQKPAIWVDAGIHAREWISPSTAIYFINQLINNAADATVRQVLERFDWFILPLHNPDGYEYTHTNERLWRKTRTPTDPVWDCYGADPNRNFGYQWGGDGASPEPCSDTYRGDSAFSEPCAQRVRDFVTPRANQFRAFVTMHSYGQWWFTPWGYTANEVPRDYDDQAAVGEVVADAIFAVNGRSYTVGPSSILLYVASGGSDDWSYGSLGIKYSYCPELPDEGFGFEIPREYITPVGRETFEGIKAMANEIWTREGLGS